MNLVFSTNENKIITNVETKKTKSITSISTSAINNRYFTNEYVGSTTK